MSFYEEILFENDCAKYWIDGAIFFVEIKPVVLDLEMAQLGLNDRIKLCEGVSYPTLIDLTKIKRTTKEAQNYLGSPKGSESITAGAFYTKSNIGKVVGNLFLTFQKPLAPTKIFTNKEKAISWLSNFC